MGGPGRVQAHPNVDCALPIKILKLKYSNRTFKYPIKAIKGPDCALPPLKRWLCHCTYDIIAICHLLKHFVIIAQAQNRLAII